MKMSHDAGSTKFKPKEKDLKQIQEEAKINVHQSQVILDLGGKKINQNTLQNAQVSANR